MRLTVDGATYNVSIDMDSVSVNGARFKVRREGSGAIVTVTVDGRPYKVDLGNGAGSILVDGRAYLASLEGAAGNGRPTAAVPAGPKRQARAGSVSALMPGKIIAVRVKEGESVAAGDVLLILEAMKMENEILAPKAGIVRSLPVVPGNNVNKGDLLVVVE
jgi:glutaconyl-CoA decarboxylase